MPKIRSAGQRVPKLSSGQTDKQTHTHTNRPVYVKLLPTRLHGQQTLTETDVDINPLSIKKCLNRPCDIFLFNFRKYCAVLLSFSAQLSQHSGNFIIGTV